jgi:hypothetical protein
MAVPLLSHDGDPEVRQVDCEHCGTPYLQSIGFVMADGDANAIYYASLHHHDGQHDAWLDVILGSWPNGDDEAYPPDHVTFSCRVGPGSAAPEPYASLVQAPASATGENTELFGQMLTREEAKEHPMLADFWRVVDFVIEHDARVRDHLHHQPLADA